jgi:hypothetical protein
MVDIFKALTPKSLVKQRRAATIGLSVITLPQYAAAPPFEPIKQPEIFP